MQTSVWLIPSLLLAHYLGILQLYLLTLSSIVIHELSHGLAAILSGVRIRSFSIGPTGAVLTLQPSKYGQVASPWICLAGPVCNILCALICFWRFQWITIMGGTAELNRELWRSGCLIHCELALFNLLPAYPLDGGKVLLAFLEKRTGKDEAFQKIYLFSSILLFSIFFLGIYLVQYQIVNFFLCVLVVRCGIQLWTDRQYLVMRRVIHGQTSNERKVE